MSEKTPQTNSDGEMSSRKAVKVVLWFIVGALLLAAFCCLATLATLWFTGDSIVEFFRNAAAY